MNKKELEIKLGTELWKVETNGMDVLNEIYRYMESTDECFEDMVAGVLTIIAEKQCPWEMISNMAQHMRLKYAEETP